ncbi:hypothetical protein FKM82_027540 [Ascaphus truei]
MAPKCNPVPKSSPPFLNRFQSQARKYNEQLEHFILTVHSTAYTGYSNLGPSPSGCPWTFIPSPRPPGAELFPYSLIE